MPLVNLISSGIGLAFEANAARKAHKADKAIRAGKSRSSPEDRNPSTPIADENVLVDVSDDQAKELIDNGHAIPIDSKKQLECDQEHDLDPDVLDPPPAYAPADQMDEADWQLDEAREDTSRSPSPDLQPGQVASKKEARQHYVDKIVNKFLIDYPPPSNSQPTGNLPCPVIIPQRRPHKKSRGFVQAYAPVLDKCAINQDAFMHFHKAMFKASQVSDCIHGSRLKSLRLLKLTYCDEGFSGV